MNLQDCRCSRMIMLLLWLDTRLILIKESRKKKDGNICQFGRRPCSHRRSNNGNFRNYQCNPALGKLKAVIHVALKSDSDTRWGEKNGISKTKQISRVSKQDFISY